MHEGESNLQSMFFNAVEGSISGETVLKSKYLSQVKDTAEHGLYIFVGVLDIWIHLITETQMLMDVRLPALTA